MLHNVTIHHNLTFVPIILVMLAHLHFPKNMLNNYAIN